MNASPWSPEQHQRAIWGHIAAATNAPRRFGVNDCAFFAANWILLRTGRDPLHAWRGRWHDHKVRAEALAAGVEAFCAEHLGEHVEPVLLTDGDLALVTVPLISEPALGLLCDRHVYTPPADKGGLLKLGDHRIVHGWRVP